MEIIALLKSDFEYELRQRVDSDDPCEARIASLFVDVLDALRREPIGPRLYVSYHLDRELWLQYRSSSFANCRMTITLDCPDYGPLVDGVPVFHYRMLCFVCDSTGNQIGSSIEERTHSVQSVVDFVHDALRQTRI